MSQFEVAGAKAAGAIRAEPPIRTATRRGESSKAGVAPPTKPGARVAVTATGGPGSVATLEEATPPAAARPEWRPVIEAAGSRAAPQPRRVPSQGAAVATAAEVARPPARSTQRPAAPLARAVQTPGEGLRRVTGPGKVAEGVAGRAPATTSVGTSTATGRRATPAGRLIEPVP